MGARALFGTPLSLKPIRLRDTNMICESCDGEGERFNEEANDFVGCTDCNGTGERCDHCRRPVDECDGLCDDSYDEEEERHYEDE